ncbi:MAG TPA: delta-60 repeat domain-containing protein [Dokdonella sp.]|uniref:delta-60 repeat domain-containing protein n=1 Tax=Dokdonella sp. TaxID=2291710 RepID=UPI0025BBCEDF|nr:delta-60 repeat domain-containing protein [Dokdonella sp.]MBX3690973.1 hypothetical protein [Dokdonella sp.]MCW5567471.1 hypothetical protein [Dokdonella sp.]HNR91849.1 delta-60 repeat domain-containing protein [Dokdonella sp.]
MRRYRDCTTLLLAAALHLAPPPLAARDGVPDPAFGNHAPGVSIIDVVANPAISIDMARAVLALPDGRLLVGGTSAYASNLPTALSLVRLDANGQRDMAFGDGGKVLVTVAPGVVLQRLAALLATADGGLRLLVTGVVGNVSRLWLCHVDAAGVVQGACVELPAPPGLSFRLGRAAAVLDDQGRIVTLAPIILPGRGLSVARWQIDGSSDTSFGNGGAITITRFDELAGQASNNSVGDVKIDTQGRIVVAATSELHTTSIPVPTFAAARLLASGQPDTTFGDGGARLVPTSESLDATALALDANDGLVIGGNRLVITPTSPPVLESEFALARIDVDGDVDVGFGDAGLRRIVFRSGMPPDDACAAVIIQPDGRIAAAGHSRAPGSTGGFDLAIARLWPDGRLDEGFGNAGSGRFIGPIDLADGFGNLDAIAAIRWHDQHLVAAGYARSGYDQDEFAVVRLRADGLLDAGFE